MPVAEPWRHGAKTLATDMTSPPSSPSSWMGGVGPGAPRAHANADKFRRGSAHHGTSQHGGRPGATHGGRGWVPPMPPRRSPHGYVGEMGGASSAGGRGPSYYMPSSTSGDPNPRFAYRQFPFPGYAGPPPPSHYYWPYRPWYPGVPHNFQMSGPQVDVSRQIPFPMDENTFANAFRPESSKTTPALQGVRDFLQALGQLTTLLEDLKTRFDLSTSKIARYGSPETLSRLWQDFIRTRGALVVDGMQKKEQDKDDKSGERGIYQLQTICESLRQKLNNVKFEGAGGQVADEEGSIGSVLENVKRSGADIVSAILLMPRNLKYVDQALADAAGLSAYLDRNKEEWRTGEDWKEITRAKEDEERKKAETAAATGQEGDGMGENYDNA